MTNNTEGAKMAAPIIKALKCTQCGEPNQLYKNGHERKNCWFCKEPLEGSQIVEYRINDAWTEEKLTETKDPVLENVISLIELYKNQIPEEQYNWEEHVRDLDNIIFDIKNNLNAQEITSPES